MNASRIVLTALRYEFLMQVRRPALWLTFLGFALILINRSLANELFNPQQLSALKFSALLALFTNWLAPLGVGILLADRLPRDKRLRMEELFNTLPISTQMRVASKYLGATFATLIPAFLLFLIVLGTAVWQTGNLLLVPLGLLCYIAIVLPGMFFVAAFSIACPAVIWVPLYQFLFFGYWFWGNLLNPILGVPTLNGTIIAPIGNMISASFFGVSTFLDATGASTINGVASIVVLLGLAIVALLALSLFLKWQLVRQ